MTPPPPPPLLLYTIIDDPPPPQSFSNFILKLDWGRLIVYITHSRKPKTWSHYTLQVVTVVLWIPLPKKANCSPSCLMTWPRKSVQLKIIGIHRIYISLQPTLAFRTGTFVRMFALEQRPVPGCLLVTLGLTISRPDTYVAWPHADGNKLVLVERPNDRTVNCHAAIVIETKVASVGWVDSYVTVSVLLI